MTVAISDQRKWVEILRRQKLANAERWLRTLEEKKDLNRFVLSDYDNLLRALETTLERPDSFELAYQLIQALNTVVFGFADWDRWLQYLKQALNTSEHLRREAEEAHLLTMIARIFVHQGDLDKAKVHFQRSAAKFKKIGDQPNFGKSLGKLSNVYVLQDDLAMSERLCQQALEIAYASQDSFAVGLAYLDLSQIYLKSQNFQEGLVVAQKAHEIFSQIGQTKSSVVALINVVSFQAQLGKWAEAEQVSAQLMLTLDTSADIQSISQLKNNLGVAAFKQGDYAKAEKVWQEALQLSSQVQNPTEMANLYNNLGMVYTKLKEWETAEMMLLESAKAYLELGNVFLWANAQDNLAELYEARGETAVSQQIVKEAITVLQTIEKSPHRQKLLANMALRMEKYTSSNISFH